MKADLAILYEHPSWFEPLFQALEQRGIVFEAIRLSDHSFDPASSDIPAPVVLSRVAMSSFLREADHGIFYAEAVLDHWARNGAVVLNGADVDGQSRVGQGTSEALAASRRQSGGGAVKDRAPAKADRNVLQIQHGAPLTGTARQPKRYTREDEPRSRRYLF